MTNLLPAFITGTDSNSRCPQYFGGYAELSGHRACIYARGKGLLETTVPNVTGKPLNEAKNIITNSNLKVKIEGGGDKVLSQIPKGGIKVNQQSTITLYTEQNQTVTKTVVPNVLQKSVVQASDTLSRSNLNIKIIGAGSTPASGEVVSYKQDPPPGASVDVGTIVTVEFRRIEAGE